MSGCAGCGRPIRGRCLQAEGREFHPDCFRCAGCGRPIGEQAYVEEQGLPWHGHCHLAQQAPRCAGCGEPLQGSFLRTLSRAWHPDCLRCQACEQPIGVDAHVAQDAAFYHIDCHRQHYGLVCGYCGHPIQNGHQQSPWGEVYCDRHYHDWPACFSCARPVGGRVTGPARHLGANVVQCRLCHLDAVYDREEAARLFKAALVALAPFGVLFGDHAVHFRLVRGATLNRGPREGHLLGRIDKQWRVVQGRKTGRVLRDILIHEQLPRPLFQTIAVHELTHAWLFLFGYDDLTEAVEESLCLMVEDWWLASQDGAEYSARRRLLRNDRYTPYADTFRRVDAVINSQYLPDVASAWLGRRPE